MSDLLAVVREDEGFFLLKACSPGVKVREEEEVEEDPSFFLLFDPSSSFCSWMTEVLQNNWYAQSWMASAAELDNADDAAAADTDSNKRSSYTSKVNALRGTMQQDGTVLRIPKTVLNKWMKRVGHSSK